MKRTRPAGDRSVLACQAGLCRDADIVSMVSKKSVSIIAKIVSSAVISGSW